MASVVILGSTGYIGSRLAELLPKADKPRRSELLDYDFSKCKYVINAIGMSNQNECELDVDRCYQSNVLFPIVLCRTLPRKTKLIHISTTLSNPTGSWYSKCKHISDEYITRYKTNSIIYRLPWLFDEDFEKPAYVYSEVGSPSYIKDVLEYIVNNYKKDIGVKDVANRGVRRREMWYKDMGFDVPVKERPYDSYLAPIANGTLRSYELALAECF